MVSLNLLFPTVCLSSKVTEFPCKEWGWQNWLTNERFLVRLQNCQADKGCWKPGIIPLISILLTSTLITIRLAVPDIHGSRPVYTPLTSCFHKFNRRTSWKVGNSQRIPRVLVVVRGSHFCSPFLNGRRRGEMDRSRTIDASCVRRLYKRNDARRRRVDWRVNFSFGPAVEHGQPHRPKTGTCREEVISPSRIPFVDGSVRNWKGSPFFPWQNSR